MKRTGFTILPLHGGHAPRWLISRMENLSKKIIWLIVDEHGTREFLRRISNPYWFQALGCVLGFDWHSSGLTTVVTGVLKRALSSESYEIMVAGGKGKASLRTQSEIDKIGERFSLSSSNVERLKYSSKVCAKVDNVAIQAGYPLYHHAFFITEEGEWSVVQQGMNAQDRTARRYHWLSENLGDFIVEPHEAIVGDVKRPSVLNMTAREAEENRKICVDLVKSAPNNLISSIKRIGAFSTLDPWIQDQGSIKNIKVEGFSMPNKLNWAIFKRLYDFQPKDYEELLNFKGVGPSIVKALALISELVYGKEASWRDPVKYSFAFGGKDGVPRPIERREMDESITILYNAIEQAQIGRKEKIQAIKRLQRFATVENYISP
ncbi:MAG: DUF763 domain-containing protein [Candidatus Methylarchaceae archaeon HK02M1]|nr:DUF763 domain-containing protein [Candidatus Methylarchaceae archaeon HK02M1]